MKELRPYQKDSIQSLREGFASGHKRQVLAASTGAGKSIIAIELIRNVLEKEKRVMFLCDRRVLVGQFSQHLYAEKIQHGVIMAGNSKRMYEKVQIASVQTLEKMDGWPKVDLVIVDEIHAVMRKSLKAMMDAQPDMKIIGLTATPYQAELKNYFSSVTNVITMGELVDQGFLVPFRVFAATEIDTRGVKVTAGEWQKDELQERGLRVVGDVVADYIKISSEVWGEPRKTICFSSGVAHGAELVKRFAEQGLNFVQISYLDDDEYKADVLKEFAKPDTSILGVISTDILTRGFDQPDVEHVIIAKPLRKSFSQHVQMVGRGARTYTGKKFCVIQDNSGNWLRFSDSFSELYHDGVKTLDNDADVKKRKEPSDKEKAQSKCPHCRTIWPSLKTDICPTCGFIRERKSNVGEVAGKTDEIDGISGKKEKKEKFSTEYKTQFYHQLLQYARGKGYKDGWAYHKYHSKFGVYPSMSKGVQPVGIDVYNFIQYQNIKESKKRSAA